MKLCSNCQTCFFFIKVSKPHTKSQRRSSFVSLLPVSVEVFLFLFPDAGMYTQRSVFPCNCFGDSLDRILICVYKPDLSDVSASGFIIQYYLCISVNVRPPQFWNQLPQLLQVHKAIKEHRIHSCIKNLISFVCHAFRLKQLCLKPIKSTLLCFWILKN